jgi:hypothetical protein
MKRIHLLFVAGLLAVALGGCVVHGRGHVYASAPEPELVYVSPGVYVIADYDEPVFYSEGAYWRYYGGVWYRSSYYTGGWIRVHSVPVYVSRIDRPHTYVRYRASGRGHYRQPAYRGGPVVRDHRSRQPAYRQAPPPRGPVVHDHRSGGEVKVKAKGNTRVKVRDHR